MWFTDTMDCYSSVKISEIKKFAGKWTEVGETISGEATQIQKEKYSMFFSHHGPSFMASDVGVQLQKPGKSKGTVVGEEPKKEE